MATSKLEWAILDALADGYESVSGIWSYIRELMPELTSEDLKKHVYELYARGLILVDGESKRVDKQDILAEDTEAEYLVGKFYFGMTTIGTKEWEEASAQYDEAVDWSNAWVLHWDYKGQRGHIDGTSEQVCLKALAESRPDTDWIIDMNSLAHSEIGGFWPKYCKQISGGHRISFRLTKQKH